MSKLDILVFAPHPDDAEIGAGGTIAKHVALGKKVGVVDLTFGELSTRGTVELRKKEAEKAGNILGLTVRENLGLEDGFFQNDKSSQMKVIQTIRKYQPDIVLASAINDRHPDHGKGAELVKKAAFLSGLSKIEDGQPAWRPKHVYHYIQNDYIKPDFIVDIADHWGVKEQSIKAYASQFHNPSSTEPETFISTPEFMDFIKARAKVMGHVIGRKYGEGFTVNRTPGVDSFDGLLS